MLPSRFKLHSGIVVQLYTDIRHCLLHYVCVYVALYRGFRQRLIFQAKRATVIEQEQKQKLVEDFAQLVMRQKKSLLPFRSENPGML